MVAFTPLSTSPLSALEDRIIRRSETASVSFLDVPKPVKVNVSSTDVSAINLQVLSRTGILKLLVSSESLPLSFTESSTFLENFARQSSDVILPTLSELRNIDVKTTSSDVTAIATVTRANLVSALNSDDFFVIGFDENIETILTSLVSNDLLHATVLDSFNEIIIPLSRVDSLGVDLFDIGYFVLGQLSQDQLQVKLQDIQKINQLGPYRVRRAAPPMLRK